MLRNLLYITSVLFLFSAGIAHAQSLGAVPDPVQYIVAPETPGPGQLVSIEAQGVGSFIGNATITWEKDGKVAASSVGGTVFTFTTGGIGSVSRIKVTITSPVQGVITHNFTFYPTTTYLLWEADTTAPLFYQGKTLYSAGSPLTVVAYPVVVSGGSPLPTSKLSFQWTRNDELIAQASGLGRNTFSFIGDQIKTEENVSLDVYYNAAKVGHAEVRIPATNPSLLLYERDPLRGEVLNQALPNTVTLAGQEVTLQAEPYYFSNISRRRGTIGYTWALGDSEVRGPDSSRGILTLRQTAAGKGSSVLRVSAQNADTEALVQQAEAALQITFGQQAGSAISSFFGL